MTSSFSQHSKHPFLGFILGLLVIGIIINILTNFLFLGVIYFFSFDSVENLAKIEIIFKFIFKGIIIFLLYKYSKPVALGFFTDIVIRFIIGDYL